jgi:hypothetical protein
MAKKLSPEAQKAIEGLFVDLFLSLMIGMTKSEPVEAEFGKFSGVAKKLTKEQMQRIAALAGKYYAQRASPSPNKLSKKQVAALQVKALEYALEHLDDEQEK